MGIVRNREGDATLRALVIINDLTAPPGLLADAMAAAGWELDVRTPERGDPLPDGLDGFGALVSLGGVMGAYADAGYPHLQPEKALLRLAVAQGLPTLGICLGAQLLAMSLGAPVGPHHTPEIGWYQVALTAAGRRDPLFAGLGPLLQVLHWHNDRWELPAGAVRLARAPGCDNQAFRAGRCAYGLQFHPEVTPAILAAWAADPDFHRSGRNADGLLAFTRSAAWPGYLAQVDRLFANWVNIAAAAARAD